MSQIDELVQRLCPDGVVFRSLGEVASVSTGTRPPKEILSDLGPFGYFNGGSSASGRVMETNSNAGTITIPSRGSVGIVGYQHHDFWCGPLCYRIVSSSDQLSTRFLYFALKTTQDRIVALQQTGSIPALNKKQLVALYVPVPPLEVQAEIVRILDCFTSLEVELEAELEARKAQFGMLRETMLVPQFDNGHNCEWVELGDVIRPSFGKRITKSSSMGTLFPVYGGGGESFRTDLQNRNDEWVISRFAMSANCVRRVRGPFWLLDSGFTLTPTVSDIDLDYVGFWLSSIQEQIFRTSTKSAQKNIDIKGFLRIRMPWRALSQQRALVQRLRMFEDMVSDLTSGLPAEISARRQQYEYYRDRLLTFKEKAS